MLTSPAAHVEHIVRRECPTSLQIAHECSRAPVGRATRLILLPGMGVDSRLFDAQREAFPNVELPEWIPHRKRESLREYAARFAATLQPSDPRPLVIGGVSMGGMIALELSRHLTTAAAVILIGSCTSGRAVAPFMRAMEHFSRPVPSRLISAGRVLASPFLGQGGMPRADRRQLGQMLSDIPVPFLRWSGRAIMEWPGIDTLTTPVHQIHGSYDRVIPAERLSRPPDSIIHGGAHVLNLSHPREVNQFIADVVHRVAHSG